MRTACFPWESKVEIEHPGTKLMTDLYRIGVVMRVLTKCFSRKGGC